MNLNYVKTFSALVGTTSKSESVPLSNDNRIYTFTKQYAAMGISILFIMHQLNIIRYLD